MNEITPMLIEAETQLEQLCKLKFDIYATHYRLTGIICTLSRTSRDPQKIYKMITNGMNIVRINMSHESHEMHAKTIQMVRESERQYSKELGYNIHVAIALDTKGPEIRTGLLELGPNAEVELKKNDTVRLSINKDIMDKCTRELIYVDYSNIINIVDIGHKIFVSDGAILLIVKEVAVDCVICMVEIGGMLGSRKNIKIPGAILDLPLISQKDINDLKFAVDNNVDIIFVSAVRTAAHIKQIRNVLGEKGKELKVVAKFDGVAGLKNIYDIVAAADGIVLDRGDIGVEVPAEKMLIVQKSVLAHCVRAGKPVVLASQLLRSMMTSSIPRRSEVNDVANAVIDGADCVMASGESAIGLFPVEVVSVMNTVIREAETVMWFRSIFDGLLKNNPAAVDAAHAVAIAAIESAKKALASAIIVLTTSGRSAFLLSRYRPRCPIVALTRCPRTARQCHLYRAVIPLLYAEPQNKEWHQEVDSRLNFALNVTRKMGVVKTGDPVIVLSPWKEGTGFTNNMRVVYAFFETDNHEKIEKRPTSRLTKSVGNKK